MTYLLHEERPDLSTERVPQEVKQHHRETEGIVGKRIDQIGEVAVHRDRQAGVQLADVNRFRLMFLCQTRNKLPSRVQHTFAMATPTSAQMTA